MAVASPRSNTIRSRVDSLYPLRHNVGGSPHGAVAAHDELVPHHAHDTRHRRHISHLATALTVTQAHAKFLRGARRARQHEWSDDGGGGDDHVTAFEEAPRRPAPVALATKGKPPLIVLLSVALYVFGAVRLFLALRDDTAVSGALAPCQSSAGAPAVWPVVLASALEDLVILFMVHFVLGAALLQRFGRSQTLIVATHGVALLALGHQFRTGLFAVPGVPQPCCALSVASLGGAVSIAMLFGGAGIVVVETLAADPFHRLGLFEAYGTGLDDHELALHLSPATQPLFPTFVGPLLVVLATGAFSPERLALALSAVVWLVLTQPFCFDLAAQLAAQLFGAQSSQRTVAE